MAVLEATRRSEAPELLSARPGYFDRAFTDQAALIEQARAGLKHIDFDTFVVTGLSGTSVGGMLAYALGKNLLIIRKPDDRSNHSSRREAGMLGKRWIFLDDFISMGNTRRRVRAAVDDLLAAENKRRDEKVTYEYDGSDNYVAVPAPIERHVTTYVGTWEYQYGTFRGPEHQ